MHLRQRLIHMPGSHMAMPGSTPSYSTSSTASCECTPLEEADEADDSSGTWVLATHEGEPNRLLGSWKMKC